MTSNVGADLIRKESTIGFMSRDDVTMGFDKMKTTVLEELKKTFRPEFLNRVDDIITFHPLNQTQIRAIVDLQLAQVSQRLTEKKITLKITDKTKDWLAKKGYDSNLGARPLKRVIQTELLDPLAMDIISGRLQENMTITATVDKGKISLK